MTLVIPGSGLWGITYDHKTDTFFLCNFMCSKEIPGIIVLNKDLSIKSQFGLFGKKKESEMVQPTSLALSQTGDLVVADRGNHRIQVWSKFGEWKYNLNLKVTKPRGICILNNGNLVIANHSSVLIVKPPTNPNPTILTPQPGIGYGRLKRACGICQGPPGMIIVADQGQDKLCIFKENGNFVREFSVGLAPMHLTFLPNQQQIVVACANEGRLEVYDLDGNLVGSSKQLKSPFGVVCVGNDLFVSTWTTSRVLQIPYLQLLDSPDPPNPWVMI